MAACPPLVFDGVSPEAWEGMKADAAREGIALTADAGTLSKAGFTIAWTYNAGDRSLTVTCLKAPFFLKCEAINAKIRDLIGKRLTGTP